MPKKHKGSTIGDTAIRSGTGRRWDDWFQLLDAWGAEERGNRSTARFLRMGHGLPSWWAQTVSIRYHHERRPGS